MWPSLFPRFLITDTPAYRYQLAASARINCRSGNRSSGKFYHPAQPHGLGRVRLLLLNGKVSRSPWDLWTRLAYCSDLIYEKSLESYLKAFVRNKGGSVDKTGAKNNFCRVSITRVYTQYVRKWGKSDEKGCSFGP